jgi:hypothetical protein
MSQDTLGILGCSASAQLMKMIFGFVSSQAISVAAKLSRFEGRGFA